MEAEQAKGLKPGERVLVSTAIGGDWWLFGHVVYVSDGGLYVVVNVKARCQWVHLTERSENVERYYEDQEWQI